MASTNIILVAVFAALAVQCFAEVETYAERSVSSLFHEVVGEVEDAIKTARDETAKGIDKGIEGVNVGIAVAVEKVEMVNKMILDELTQFEEDAEESGVNIGECIVDNKEELHEKLEHVVENVKKCGKVATDGMEEVKQMLNDVMNGFLGETALLRTKFDNCKRDMCRYAVLTEAGVKCPALIIDILKAAKEIASTAATTVANGLECVSDTVDDYITETAAIKDNIKKCIEEKNNEKPIKL